MTLEQTPAPVRTDVAATRTAIVTDPPHRPFRPFRLHGTMLTVGALAWVVAQGFVGVDPVGHRDEVAFSICSGMFQVGLLFLVRVLYRTGAIGGGRLAKAILRFEAVLILVAISSTVSDGLGTTDFDRWWFVVMDACWPLSMLGMCLIGIRIAIAGRWRGVSRFWPMLAESWAVVTIPTMVAFGDTAATVVSMVHLTLGYAVLGQIVARKES